MNYLDKAKQLCANYRQKGENLQVSIPSPIGKKRARGISISDLHIPFWREDLVKEIVKKHSGDDFIVLNGDIFDCNLISTFQKRKEIPFAIEFSAVSYLVRFLAKHFGEVYLVDGNHDAGRFNRELGKINPTLNFLVKTSPLKYIADGVQCDSAGNDLGRINLHNVHYAGDVGAAGWWLQLGQCLFVHRQRGFKKAPMGNAVTANHWFLDRGTQFQAVVNGHSHRQGKIINKGKIVIDQGCLCYPMDYESDGRLTMSPVDLGYAVIEMDNRGTVDPEETKPIYIGTYQTP